MPIFAVNLPEKLFGSIRELVDRGLYQSLEGFLEVAAYNQLALERGLAPSQIIEHGHRTLLTLRPDTPAHDVGSNGAATNGPARPSHGGPKPIKTKAGRHPANKKAMAVAAPVVDAPQILARWRLPGDLNTPDTVSVPGMPTGQHLWGQVNRLFPLKLACRWIARSAANGQWPAYLAFADELANEATSVGEVLEGWDVAAGRIRDELLATGLPRRGNSASRDRFISQNLARVTRGAEVVPGAVCRYAFAECTESAVSLTADGLEFAKLANPILDAQDAGTPTTLSAEESLFLCRHIRSRVEGEYVDMVLVVASISYGNTTPSTLAKHLRGVFPSHWGESEFRTHLSGLVARLADLQVIRRRWEGRYVQYELGEDKLVKCFM